MAAHEPRCADASNRRNAVIEFSPVHQDLIVFDGTVTAGENTIVDRGCLLALRDPAVVALARNCGDPVELLESLQ